MSAKRTMLIILDGWGYGPKPEADAIAQAATPFFHQLLEKYPHSKLTTFGEQVGLPEGQMGNSEVGHLNIGSGRIVYQELARINKAIREGTLGQNPDLQATFDYARNNDKALHIMGLVSDGGVHSHINHLKALCTLAAEEGLKKVYVHAFLDGRDTDPKSGVDFLADLLDHLQDLPAELASIVGRYYAMDRDKRWERVRIAYELLVKGKGEKVKGERESILEHIQQQYEAGVTDEFMKPVALTDEAGAMIARIQPEDAVLFFNFRTDRPRQLTQVLTQTDMPDYNMYPLSLYYTTMTSYDDAFKGIHVLLTKDHIQDTLGEVIARTGQRQVRIAETEKYPHVTFFFSGGREEPFEGEHRILINSPKVATYDLQPEMSAPEVTEAILDEIQENKPTFICLNYANADMVGHTGVFQAAVQAAQAVDECLSKLVPLALEHGYELLIIADHGNADYMINKDGSPNTAHTKNPVPCIHVSQGANGGLKDGILADVAPTLLHMLGLEPPEAMTGQSLITE